MKRASDAGIEEEEAKKAKSEEATLPSPETITVTVPATALNVITQMMDIAEPLSTLKKLLEVRIQCSLDDHEVYLQNSALLDSSKSLLEQGVSAEGTVQFSCQVISAQGMENAMTGVKPRLNIVDIVKPIVETMEVTVDTTPQQVEATPTVEADTVSDKTIPLSEDSDHVTRWIVCNNYRLEQEKLGIPIDPIDWSADQTRHWLTWASKEFSTDLTPESESLKVSGKQLCEMSREEFVKKLPRPGGDIFWTHLELLRKSSAQTASVPIETAVAAEEAVAVATSVETTEATKLASTAAGKAVKTIVISSQPVKTMARSPSITGQERTSPGNRTGNNGQIQLWQFLLELLTDKDARDCISWVGDNGEFKLNNPELVAQKWGARKNKPTMNYEKLSRALRYYYDGDMIAKVHGKRFVYKFVCDLRSLMGYNAAELNKLVTDCAQKQQQQQAVISRIKSGK